MRKVKYDLAVGVLCFALVLVASVVFGQDEPEVLENRPVSLGLLTGFLDRYGHTIYETAEDEDSRVIRFSVADRRQEETIDFVILYLPRTETIKVECPHLTNVPSAPGQRAEVLRRLMALNGVRTVGKYCFDKDNASVRHFYYRTVAGGLCYADFSKTLRMIEYTVFKDLSGIRGDADSE